MDERQLLVSSVRSHECACRSMNCERTRQRIRLQKVDKVKEKREEQLEESSWIEMKERSQIKFTTALAANKRRRRRRHSRHRHQQHESQQQSSGIKSSSTTLTSSLSSSEQTTIGGSLLISPTSKPSKLIMSMILLVCCLLSAVPHLKLTSQAAASSDQIGKFYETQRQICERTFIISRQN